MNSLYEDFEFEEDNPGKSNTDYPPGGWCVRGAPFRLLGEGGGRRLEGRGRRGGAGAGRISHHEAKRRTSVFFLRPLEAGNPGKWPIATTLWHAPPFCGVRA